MNKIMLGLVLPIMLVLLTFMVSAIDISYSDNYLTKSRVSDTGYTSGDVNVINNAIQNIDNTTDPNQLILSKYPQVTIDSGTGIFNGFLSLMGVHNQIMDVKLIDNTEYCTVDCYSILQVILYQKAALLDSLQTKSYIDNTLQNNNNVQTSVYVLKNINTTVLVPTFTQSCTTISNPTGPSFIHCLDLENGTIPTIETTQQFVPYNNEELDSGTYVVKIIGKKNSFNQVVDWVPTIQGQEITALAWWNITNVYGDGSLGNVYFSTSTKTFGNMINGVDYNYAGNTLYLRTDRAYQFNSFYLGPGTLLSTQNTTGAAMYIMAKTNLDIEGIINLTNVLLPGGLNSTSFNYLGDSFTTPNVANGASAYFGGIQSGGFGGGATSGVSSEVGCSTPTAGVGASGNYPFGSGGSGGAATSTHAGCATINGGNGVRSGGGGGPGQAFDNSGGSYYGCTIHGTGAVGGGSYGTNGGNGATSGTHVTTWNCYSGAVGSGGGGAGGIAGTSGLNLVLRGMNTTISNTISLSGTNGGKGGNGGYYSYGYWVSNSWANYNGGDNGYGGGGGGGASAGNLKVYYRFLNNNTALNNLVLQTGGTGGAGGTWYSGINAANSGSSGSSGTISLYAEGYTITTLLNPQNNTNVVISPIINFTANVTPTLATLVNATFYLWKNGVLNNTQTTVLSGTAPVSLSWIRTSDEMPDDSWAWAVNTCWTDGTVPICSWTANNTFTTFSVQFIYPSVYHNITYEMVNETYSMNALSTGFANLTGHLEWNGQEYSVVTTGNSTNSTFTSTIWIPTGPGQKSFNWNINYGGQLKQSIPENVTVLNSQFAICNSTINTTYLTINYKDETTNNPINATIVNSVWNYNITNSPYGENYLYNSPYINSTQVTALQHNFCFIPSYASILMSTATYQYGNPTLGYATKLWTFNTLPLSNTTTAITLYLINLVDSGTSPVTFQAINSQTNTIMSGVQINIYRTIAGQSTLVDQGLTDAAGTIAFYMSPVTAYTITASGAGCNPLTSTITPTSNQYNLQLSCSSSTTQQFSSLLDGVTYQRTPADGITLPGTNTYTYQINSATLNITRVQFSLINAIDGTILATNNSLTNVPGCSPTSCFLTLVYTSYTGDNIKGRYYAAVNGTDDSSLVLVEGDAYWRFIKINQNNSVNAIGRFMVNVQDLFNSWGTSTPNCMIYTYQTSCNAVPECKWVSQTVWAPSSSVDYQTATSFCVARDDLNKTEFNRMVTIFFFFAIFLFIVGRTTGYELNHPGAFVAGMGAVIWILSMYGMFTFAGLTQYDFFNQYIFALSSGCISIGYVISVIRRYSG